MHRESVNTEVTRRKALVLIGAAGVAAIGGCPLGADTDISDANGSGSGSTDALSCVVTPEQTEGPYFVDELLNRADIRSNPSDGATHAGVPLRLRISVAQVSGGVCSALSGATVDVWHCNAQGLYSDVSANRTVGQKFLRGYQVSDSNGDVEFMTIYPGWYSGRTVHIHFKVRIGSLEFNSQLYFDEAVTAQVYSRSPYNARGAQNTTNATDTIFSRQTLLTLTPDGDGYLGTFRIGLETP